MWIVFIYRCLNKNPQILLKKGKGFSPVVLKNVAPGDFNRAKTEFKKITGISKSDCFPQRFFESAHSFQDETSGEIWTTSVRLLKQKPLKIFDGEWFSESETDQKLSSNKIYEKAFREEFGKDDYWKCLEST